MEEGSDDYENFCVLIGMMTLMWSDVENVLTHMAGIIGGFLWSPIEDHAELPRPPGRQLRFVRRAFNTVASLEPFKDRAIPLFEAFGELKLERDALTHGAAEQLRGNQFVIRQILTKGRLQSHTEKVVTVESVTLLNLRMGDVAEEMEILLFDVAKLVGLHP
jgi:hypothetical protein